MIRDVEYGHAVQGNNMSFISTNKQPSQYPNMHAYKKLVNSENWTLKLKCYVKFKLEKKNKQPNDHPCDDYVITP